MQDTTDHKARVAARLRARREERRRMFAALSHVTYPTPNTIVPDFAKLADALGRMGELLPADAFAPRPTGWDDLYRNGASALERA